MRAFETEWRTFREKTFQEKRAERADLRHNYIGELESGEKAATSDTRLKLAKAFGMRVGDLVDRM